MDQEQIKEKVRNYILTDLLKHNDYPLAYDEPLLSGGLIDSHNIVHLAVFIEDTFGVYIPDDELTAEQIDTVNLIAEQITKYKNPGKRY